MPALKDNDLKVKYIIRNFDHYRGFLPRLDILLNWQFNMPTAINRLVIPAKAGIQYFIGFLDSGSPPDQVRGAAGMTCLIAGLIKPFNSSVYRQPWNVKLES